jgi:DNA end-binding protein Ku
LKALVEKKAKGQKIVTAPESEAPHGNVINLMDALRKSVEGGSKAKSAKAPDKPAKRPGVKKSA